MNKSGLFIALGLISGFGGYLVIWLCLLGWTETVGIEKVSAKLMPINLWISMMWLEPVLPYLLLLLFKLTFKNRCNLYLYWVFWGCAGGTVVALAIILMLGNMSVG